MAERCRGNDRAEDNPGELLLAELRESVAPSVRLVELFDKARDQALGWDSRLIEGVWIGSERDELLAHPDLSPELVGLLIEWACDHFRQGYNELSQILERGHWNALEKPHVTRGYNNPYGGSPVRLHYTPWQNWAERAEGVFALAYPPDRQWATPELFHPQPATNADRQRGHDIIVRRVHYGSWLPQIIEAKPKIALTHDELIRASEDPLAIEALDQIEAGLAASV